MDKHKKIIKVVIRIFITNNKLPLHSLRFCCRPAI